MQHLMTSGRPLTLLVVGVGLVGCLEAPASLSEAQFDDLFAHGDAIGGDGTDGDTNEGDGDATEVGDTGDDADVGPDCTTEAQLLTTTCLPASRELWIFEPAYEGDAGGPPLGWAEPEHPPAGASTWRRAGEIIEVMLESGSPSDPSLVAYYPFEDTLDNVASGGHAFSDGPDGGARFVPAEALFGVSLDGGPRFGGDFGAPVAQGSFTMMARFFLDGPSSATATYDLIGLETAVAQPPELALGITEGAWVAHLAGQTIPFGEARGGWQHVGLAWDAATGVAVLYFDGVVRSVLRPELTLASTRLFIGRGSPDGGPPPSVDEVMVYTRVIDPDELRGYVQLDAPLGTRLIPEAQADYDDLRVVLEEETILAREIIGRRPHGDSGAEVEQVLAVWPFDGASLEPSFASTEAYATSVIGDPDPLTLVSEMGAFGDAGGAIRASAPGRAQLAVGRSGFGGELTIELWLRVAAGETTACAGDFDGAVIVHAQDREPAVTQGFALRLCEGELELTTSAATVRGTRPLNDDRWHHVMATFSATEHTLIVDGVVDASVVPSGQPSDARLALTLLHRPGLTAEGGPPHLSDVVIDDLVLHSVARLPGYAYSRAWPRQPHVRFMVDTHDGAGGMQVVSPIALRAGNAALPAPAVNACGSLVSSCTGVVAWWRMDRGDPTTAFDVSAGGRHLPATGVPTLTAGIDGGLAVELDGASQFFRRDPAGEFGLAAWTVEAAVSPRDAELAQTIVERPGLGEPPSVSLNYALRLADTGAVTMTYVLVGDPAEMASSSAVVAAGGWTAIGGGYQGGELFASLGGVLETAGTTVAPTPSTDRGPLFIGRGGRPTEPEYFGGALDSVRVMSRALAPEELLHYPPLAWRPRDP